MEVGVFCHDDQIVSPAFPALPLTAAQILRQAHFTDYTFVLAVITARSTRD